MKLELFSRKQFSSVKQVKFLLNRNLLGILTLNEVLIYRIFEEIKTLKATKFTFHPSEAIVCLVDANGLQFCDLETDTNTLVHSIDDLDATEVIAIEWKAYLKNTLLLVGYKNHIEVRFDGQLRLLKLDIPNVTHLDIIDNIFIAVQEDGQNDSLINLIMLENHPDNSNLSHLSKLQKDLNQNVSQINQTMDKLEIELKSLSDVFKKFINLIDSAFEGHSEKPTELHWKRLLFLGDSQHIILTTLLPFVKTIQTVQKGLASSSLKLTTLFQQLFDLLISLRVSISTLSEIHRFIPSTTPVLPDTKHNLDVITTNLTNYYRLVSSSISGLTNLTIFLESSQTADYTFPTSTENFFLYDKFNVEEYNSTIANFKSLVTDIQSSCQLIQPPTTNSTLLVKGKFQGIYEGQIVSTNSSLLYLTTLDGKTITINFDREIISLNQTKSGLFILTTNLWIYDSLGKRMLTGFESVDLRGVVGNVGKGMVSVWGDDGIDLYDLVDSDDDEEMEE